MQRWAANTNIAEIVVEQGIFSQLGCRVLAKQRAARKSWTALGAESEGIEQRSTLLL